MFLKLSYLTLYKGGETSLVQRLMSTVQKVAPNYHQRKMAAAQDAYTFIIWLHFRTVGGRGGARSVFIYSR